MRRASDIDRNNGIPPSLPDHLRCLMITFDLDADRANRRLEAFSAFRDYSRELDAFLRTFPGRYQTSAVQAALGTSLSDFLSLADRVDEQVR